MKPDAVQACFPSVPLVAPRDYSLNPDGSIKEWKIKRYTQPTPEQLAAAKIALDAKTAQIATIHAGLLSLFNALSPGEQALYKPAFEGVRAMLLRGDLVEAKKIIFLSPVPTDDLATARTAMLALFP